MLKKVRFRCFGNTGVVAHAGGASYSNSASSSSSRALLLSAGSSYFEDGVSGGGLLLSTSGVTGALSEPSVRAVPGLEGATPIGCRESR